MTVEVAVSHLKVLINLCQLQVLASFGVMCQIMFFFVHEKIPVDTLSSAPLLCVYTQCFLLHFLR